MRAPSIYIKTLRDQQWQIVGFGLVLAVIAVLDVFIWPSYRDTLQNLDLPPALEAFLGTELSIATGPGFLSAEFFSWIPILLLVYAVIHGTGAVAGEESSGTMDLLLAQPVTRRAVVLQKAAATVTGSALIVAIGYSGFAVSLPFVEIDVTLAEAAVACANMLPITLFFFALSLLFGALAPSRAAAVAASIAVATAGYFANTIASAVEALDALKYASPFYYYGAGLPLVRGIEWPHVALLLGLATAFVLLTLRAFERRDVAAGAGREVDLLAPFRAALGRHEATSAE